MLQRENDPPLSERQRKMVDEAEKSCARLVALIGELSEISKLDSGLAAVKEEPFDLFAVLQEVANDVHEAQDREVHLVVRGAPSGAQMKGDLTRLRTAFAALFRAVLREQPSAATVVVERRRRAEGASTSAVVVVARDEEVQAALDASPAPFDDKRGGLGLQLQIALRVLGRHGGRVWSPAAASGADSVRARSAILASFPLSAT
jgi:signal transduction histidine kinase